MRFLAFGTLLSSWGARAQGFADIVKGWEDLDFEEECKSGCNVVVSLASDSLRSCLAVTNHTLPPLLAGNGTCISTPGWFDGSNG